MIKYEAAKILKLKIQYQQFQRETILERATEKQLASVTKLAKMQWKVTGEENGVLEIKQLGPFGEVMGTGYINEDGSYGRK